MLVNATTGWEQNLLHVWLQLFTFRKECLYSKNSESHTYISWLPQWCMCLMLRLVKLWGMGSRSLTRYYDKLLHFWTPVMSHFFLIFHIFWCSDFPFMYHLVCSVNVLSTLWIFHLCCWCSVLAVDVLSLLLMSCLHWWCTIFSMDVPSFLLLFCLVTAMDVPSLLWKFHFCCGCSV